MTDLLAEISAWSVLKWVLIVLVAGFIGQFGKSLAQAVMKKIRLKKEEKTAVRKDVTGLPSSPDLSTGAAPSPSPGDAVQDVVPPPVQGSADKTAEKTVKKSRKTLLKSRKKADKNNP